MTEDIGAMRKLASLLCLILIIATTAGTKPVPEIVEEVGPPS